MKYIVEITTTRRYEDINAENEVAAVERVKSTPILNHREIRESADVIVEEDGDGIVVLKLTWPLWIGFKATS